MKEQTLHVVSALSYSITLKRAFNKMGVADKIRRKGLLR